MSERRTQGSCRLKSLAEMVKQKKRAAATPATTPMKKTKKTKRVYTEVPDLTELAFAPLEHMEIGVHRKQPPRDDLKLADIYGFMKWSIQLPELDYELVTEFLENYDINKGSSLVSGRRIVLTELLLHKAMHLPISEVGVGDAKPPPDFNPGMYFKTGMDALAAEQGWKIGEAISPDLIEFMRFAQRRLVLGVHGTYLAQKYLYAITQTYNGMKFNWALFVVERIYQELEYKRRKGKIGTLLAASYICAAIKYQLSQPLTESDEELAKEREMPAPTEEGATAMEVEDPLEGEPEPARRTRQQVAATQKKKQVVESSSPVRKRRKQTELRPRSPGPFVPTTGGSSGPKSPVQEEEVRVADALKQTAMEPAKLQEHVIIGLEQLLVWVKNQSVVDYAKQEAELTEIRERAKGLQADCIVMTRAVAELKKKKEEAEKERDSQAAEVKREKNRNEIAYRTWDDEKKTLQEKIRKNQVEHQRIKDDLDNQLSRALHDNLALQDSVRERDNKLRQLELEREREKSVVDVGVQAGLRGSPELDTEAYKRTILRLTAQLQSLGRYNDELLQKYEPPSASEAEESDEEGESDEEEELVVLSEAPVGMVGNRGEKGKAVVYKETGSNVMEPSISVSPIPMAKEKRTEGEAEMATGSKGTGLSVQDPAKAKDSEDDAWLDAIASTPIQDSPAEATVAAVEPTVTPTEELATESAPVANSIANSVALATEAVETTPVQDDAGELVAVQSVDSVVEIVPQNCEDAIK